jgi:hypothetical protein
MLYISVDFVVQLLTGKPFSSLAASYMGKNSLRAYLMIESISPYSSDPTYSLKPSKRSLVT